MIKPKPLSRGDKIGLIGPSSPTPSKRIKPTIEKLENMGFEVVVGESCYGSYGYLSGDDNLRARDVNEMFKNKDIDGIWCIRGGYGTPRILDMIDYDEIALNPKVFIGYSDITALHIAINQRCNLVTYHGPMASTNSFHNIDDYTLDSLKKNIMGSKPLGLINNPEGIELETLIGGICEGRITGGNLALISSTIGTPYEIDTKGKILFIEDVDEEPYRIDKMLTQLRLSGKLDDAKGFILGNFNNCSAKISEESLTLKDVFNDILLPLGKPTISNLMVGHCSPMITLPYGEYARLDADKKEVIVY